MNKKRKLKFKKLKLHPISTYLILIALTIILSFILSLLNFQTTYSTVSSIDLSMVQNTVQVENLLSFDGLKYIISNATRNFISFAPLSMFLLMAIAMSIMDSSGCLEFLNKKVFSKINNKVLTFIIIFIATISTMINDIGYVVLMPLAASIYEKKGRNPMSGIMAAFCGVAFGASTSIFVGSAEVSLIPYTTSAARIIDSTFHVSLLSNLFIMIVSSIVLSIVGTVIVEKVIVSYFGKIKEKKEIENLEEVEVIEVIDANPEEERLNQEYLENRGFKYSLIAFIIMIVFFIYSVIPNLPLSGLLLDMTEKTYLKQIFGENSYFQDGFTFMMSLLFIVTGLFYGIGSKKFKDDRDVFRLSHDSLKDFGGVIVLIFLASQFIAIFKKTNIGIILTGIVANVIDSLTFSGIPLLIISILLIALATLFLTTAGGKWEILAPVIVPPLMQSNISPQFLQFVLRAGDSMTKGITPLSAFFVIFLAYMNIYNKDSEPIGIFKAIKYTMPYFIIISVTWLLLLIGWYIIGLPIGPGVYPTV
ncbi:MAG: AbgT family transporter [Bacilli bacterium]|nr:AbgT family transporter [Bacilli bacterium]